MLWIINGLVYGFFMALYTLVNQHHKFNGYVLGIWRGFGIAFIFVPFLFFIPLQTDLKNWALLIFQGVLIGIYDSHIFFASAKFGAGTTSKLLGLSVLVTTVLWWILTPHQFYRLVQNENIFITLLLALFGFCCCYWYMMKNRVTREAFFYMVPAIFALAGMSIATKEIAMMRQDVVCNILYYLAVSTGVSGFYNLIFLIVTTPDKNIVMQQVFAKEIVTTGIYIISFSAALIAAKTMAMRLAPNPGYVVTLLLTAPLFVWLLNSKVPKENKTSAKAGSP
ncbi:MAG: hypothetical protein MJ210_02560 [Alphaproteobacteria bacterium]|nr:hypothetical protein [Alphaproteobacteria bacterium]